jgi:hypothetical protein
LSNNYTSLSVANNFEQHTALIQNLTYLLEDAAESAHLTSDHLSGFDNVGYVWRELLQTTENVGQCRAIGTGVAVQKNCSSVDKIRLSYLLQNLTQISDSTLHNLPCLPEEKSEHERLVQRAKSNMSQLFSVIKTELLEGQKITVDSGGYFQLATDTMAGINDIFDHQLKQLKRVV